MISEVSMLQIEQFIIIIGLYRAYKDSDFFVRLYQMWLKKDFLLLIEYRVVGKNSLNLLCFILFALSLWYETIDNSDFCSRSSLLRRGSDIC